MYIKCWLKNLFVRISIHNFYLVGPFFLELRDVFLGPGWPFRCPRRCGRALEEVVGFGVGWFAIRRRPCRILVGSVRDVVLSRRSVVACNSSKGDHTKTMMISSFSSALGDRRPVCCCIGSRGICGRCRFRRRRGRWEASWRRRRWGCSPCW